MRRAAPLLLSLVLVAGCGGSSSDRLTRAQYAAKADAVCAKYKQKTNGLQRPSDLAGFVRLADQALPILHRARGELRSLRPPASEEATAKAWLDEFDVLIHDVEQLRDKAKDSDAAGIQKILQTSLQHNRRANELGVQLGMKVCSRD